MSDQSPKRREESRVTPTSSSRERHSQEQSETSPGGLVASLIIVTAVGAAFWVAAWLILDFLSA